MSRIGKLPVTIPAGVTVDVNGGVITVKGAKGTLSQDYDAKNIVITVEGNTATLTRNSEDKEVRAKHGLYRALLHNMVVGVTEGFKKTLVLAGVGYKAQKQGNKVVLNVGYSHPVEIFETADVKLDVPSLTEVVVSGIDKAAVGQYAATVRAIRKPEPYHGYGIHYSDEVIERKEGKTAGK